MRTLKTDGLIGHEGAAPLSGSEQQQMKLTVGADPEARAAEVVTSMRQRAGCSSWRRQILKWVGLKTVNNINKRKA